MNKYFLTAALVATIISLAIGYHGNQNAGNPDPGPVVSTFDKVENAKSIECGYISYPPAIYVDETGSVVGVFAESMEKAASNLGWEVNWIEGNWPDLIPNLNSGRWDAFCSAAWKNSARIRAADFSIPLYYSYLSVWGRAELSEISLDQLNSEEYTVAVLDGDTSMAVADQKFDSSKRFALTQLNSYSDIFDSIASGRADFTIAEASYVRQYNLAKEDIVLVELGGKPIRIYPNVMMFRKSDIDLRRAISGSLEELINEGFVDSLIEKYDAEGEVLPVAPSYEASN